LRRAPRNHRGSIVVLGSRETQPFSDVEGFGNSANRSDVDAVQAD
jgi:hypothetical protein